MTKQDPIEAFRAKLLAAQWDGSMTCPVTAPTPKNRKLYTIPVDVRAALICIVQERRRMNVRINTESPAYGKLSDEERKKLDSICSITSAEYYRVSTVVDSEYENILRRLRQEARLGRDTMVELHGGWTYSQTTLRHLRRTYEAAQKKVQKKATASSSKSGPTNDYRFPMPEVCHLSQYYLSKSGGVPNITLLNHLERERATHASPKEL